MSGTTVGVRVRERDETKNGNEPSDQPTVVVVVRPPNYRKKRFVVCTTWMLQLFLCFQFAVVVVMVVNVVLRRRGDVNTYS